MNIIIEFILYYIFVKKLLANIIWEVCTTYEDFFFRSIYNL